MSSSSTLLRCLLIGTVEDELLLVVVIRVELGFCSATDGVERWRGEWPGDSNMVGRKNLRFGKRLSEFLSFFFFFWKLRREER